MIQILVLRSPYHRFLRLLADFILGVIACFPLAQTVSAQDVTTMKLTLHPNSPVEPGLKYRLLPPLQEQTPGNAAVLYGKVMAEQRAIWHNAEYWKNQDNYTTYGVMSLDELRERQELRFIVGNSGLFDTLLSAGRCNNCDWQLPIYDGHYGEIGLPEVQQSRLFSKLISLRARWQMANGDLEGALLSIQSGLALARHVSNAPTFVNAEVGSVIVRNQFVTLAEWIQQPGAPNLYWTLSALPDPIIDFRLSKESVLTILPLSFDFIANLESDDFSDEYWTEQLATVWEQFEENNADVLRKLEPLEKIVEKGYPLAKSRLLQSGMSSERIDKMPVAQVVLLQGVRDFQHQLETRYRWTFLPYAQAIERLGNEAETSNAASDVFPFPLFYDYPFADILASDYQARRSIALLRTFEAIRFYAATHDGKLPPNLAAIAEVPVPNDPITGLPFLYRLDGETAVIDVSAYKSDHNRFEIKIGT